MIKHLMACGFIAVNLSAQASDQNEEHIQVGRAFHKQADEYAEARRAYCPEIFDVIMEKLAARQANDIKVLDLGCGTGIATRVLFDHGLTTIRGLDISEGMLAKAKEFAEHSSVPRENYFQGDVVNLENVFAGEQFDVITAFSAFHWFHTPGEVEAIKAALKEDGLFIVGDGRLNRGISKEKQELWDLIESLQGKPVHDGHGNFDPIATLQEHGFIVDVYHFTTEEVWDLETAIKRQMTFSGWCNLTDEQKEKGLPLLRKLIEGQIARQNVGDGKLHEQKQQSVLIAHLS